MAEEMETAPDETPDSGAMSDEELAALLAAHEARAVGYYNSEIADQQAKAINYYYGIMDDLPALDGCSSVVDHTVSVMVDNGLAAILKPFVSAEEVVAFAPRSEEDMDQAEQATEYVNFVLNCDNPGFLIFHDWFKDALLTKLGIVKTWWEDTSRSEIAYVPLDASEIEAARQHEDYLDEVDHGNGMFTVQMNSPIPDGRQKVVNIPPEEFLISPFARSIEEAAYVAHRPSNMTRSTLLEMSRSFEDSGQIEEVINSLPAFAQGQNEESRSQARYRDEEWFSGTREAIGTDKSRDIIGVLDEYVRCDCDGDGVAELRRVIRVDDTILFNEEVEEAPFALICPVPMPHKVYGRSIADQAMEGQKVLAALTRQTLDNVYKHNNPRPIVGDRGLSANGNATMDALGDSSPGAAIPVNDVGQIDWMVVPFTADKSFGMMEAIAQSVEERTGIQRKGNGFNAEALSKNSQDTATEAAIDENSRNERAEMIARIFAETGVKRLFKLILKDLIKHQPRERMIRLRNKWVSVDPSGWNPDMDLTISVGLGMGNKMEQIGQADAVLATMAELQQTPYAYLINAENVHNALKRKFTAAGIKNVDDFLVDPTESKPPPPQPDPEMAKVQGEMQLKQADQQMRQQEAAMKLQLARDDAVAKAQLAREEAAARIQAMREEAALNLQLQRERAAFEADLAREKMEREFALAERRMEIDAQLASQRNANDYDAKIQKNRAGGDLDK